MRRKIKGEKNTRTEKKTQTVEKITSIGQGQYGGKKVKDKRQKPKDREEKSSWSVNVSKKNYKQSLLEKIRNNK